MPSQAQIDALEYVPNATLRRHVKRAVDQGRISYRYLAREVGLMRNGNKPDNTRLTRALGIKSNSGLHQEYIEYDLAVRIVRVMGLDPVDCGV